jgi:CheY-like chemotaxis protein
MTGLEVAAAMRDRGYDGPIILATGYAELGEADQDELAALQGVLTKPYSIHELETLLARFEVAAADAGLQTVK